MNQYIEMVTGPGIIGSAILLTGWLMKKALAFLFEMLITYIKNLLIKLDDTTTKVGVLDSRLSELITNVAEVHKLRADVNQFYSRLKDLEQKFEKH